ncbi:MAG: AAA family ATPase [Deltaproteobacteria bacterium]|nr:AAA family ATPase [Deltaproteobacteria bacterium]
MVTAMRCAKCGADNREGRKFCTQCGSALAAKCPRCGAAIEPAEKFCGECGAGLGSPPTVVRKSEESQVLVAGTPAPQNLEGERKTVTALFADIKGSMELIEDLDPEEARAIVDPALKLMMEAVQRYGGYVAQSTGDGIFALFGAPVAHEDHPQRALLAALRMQAEVKRYADKLRAEKGVNVQVRVGANTGEVVVREIQTGEKHTEYLPMGHSTGVAARLQSLAAPGSIAITETVRKLVEGYFALKSLGPARIKGVSEPLEISEVTGLGPLRTRLQRGAARGYTKFVGRQREMETLKDAAGLAQAGHGQIVAAVAKPGVGKSRLFFEFKAKSQSGWMVLEALSVSHGQASAYLPTLDLLHSYFDIKSEDDARKRREKVAGKITVLDRSLEDTLPYLFVLLGIVEGEDALAQMDAQVKKRRTLEAIKRILLRESLNQPLIVMFEDLHWIDEQTQEFLNLLADSLANAKLLLLVNYRPREYSHQWGSKTYYTQLRLDPLGAESADEMLLALLGDSPDLAPLKQLIIERTEGNPFFMEEMYQAMLEDGVIARNGAVKLVKPLKSARIPATVQGVLAARIDRLPSDAKQLLQTLSVLGREFPLSLIRAVVTRSDDQLNRMLNDLQLGEFIYEQPAVGDTEFIFKHALTQEVAYSSVLIELRKALHEAIGRALETLYANSLDDHLAALAHHYGRGNKPDKAMRYLTLAGKQALERSAFAESRTLLQKGLELTDTVPESPERDASEFELASALVQVLMRTKGFAAPEFVHAAKRARTLAEKRGNLAELVEQLSVARLGALITGDYPTAAALADEIFDLAQRDGSRVSLELGHATQLQEHSARGDFAAAEQDFARWSEVAGARPFPMWFGATIGAASVSAWALGHADSARERIAQAIAMARNKNDPYQLTIARYFEGLLYRLFREPRYVEAASEQALAISEEHGFTLYKERARTLLGWAKAHLGSTNQGVSLIRQGIAGYLDAGGKAEINLLLTNLAEAQALDNALDDALATIDNAVAASAELRWVPDALTCRGELQLKLGHAEIADTDFRRAIALAETMNAKTLELRATKHLARLLRDIDRRDEARAMLSEIYNWFTEGFDTADLKDAEALLDQMNS